MTKKRFKNSIPNIPPLKDFQLDLTTPKIRGIWIQIPSQKIGEAIDLYKAFQLEMHEIRSYIMGNWN